MMDKNIFNSYPFRWIEKFNAGLHEIIFRDPIFRSYKIFNKTWSRYYNLISYIELLEERDYYIARAAQVGIIGRESIQEHLDMIFPNCASRTSDYVMSGYKLKRGWEKKIHYYVMDKKLGVLDDETIFILFSLNLSRKKLLELSTLPKSYLAALLPIKKDLTYL
jgi:hypothetical protein